MAAYYLSHYIGAGTPDDPCVPVGSEQFGWSAIDLRPNGGATPDGSGLNACLLSLPEEIHDTRITLIGTDADDVVLPATITMINRILGTHCTPGSLRSVIAQILMKPPTRAGWNPIQPNANNLEVDIYLGGRIWNQTPTPDQNHSLRYGEVILCLGGCHVWLEELGCWMAILAGGAELAADDFNRGNENPLAGNWSTAGGATDFRIVGQDAQSVTTATHAAAFWNALIWPNDQYSQATLTAAGSLIASGTLTRQSGATQKSFYYGSMATATKRIAKFVADVETNLQSITATTFVVGDVFSLEAQGSTIRYKKNGIEQTGSPVTDTALTAGNAGMWSFRNDTAIDDWSGGDFGAAGQPAASRMIKHAFGLAKWSLRRV